MKRQTIVRTAGLVLLVGFGAFRVAHPAERAQPIVIFDMNTAKHRPTTTGQEGHPIGTVESVPGKVDGACRFSFVENARSGFFVASVPPSTGWDRAAGLSFWVKGDGSSHWGGLELIDGSNYSQRYGYCFPIDSIQWRKITVPWCDLVPELPAGEPVDAQSGYRPSAFGNLWFGKWYYWGRYPAHSFTIDQVALESTIDVDQTDYTPGAPGTPRLLARLSAGEPVTIVTMGDSLSDKRHWANRDVLWSELLIQKLIAKYGSQVELINPAIGGTQLTQNLVLMPRWLKETPEPDLITVWYGYNDWDGGMRGDHFAKMLRFAVERIRRLTGGRSEIVLVTTCPAVARWDTMEELAEAVRDVAAEKRTGLADVAAAFRQAGANESSRLSLYCRDRVHLGPAGHTLAAETVLEAIAETAASGEPGRGETTGNPKASAEPAEARAFIKRHPVPKEHPRLFGPRERLQKLARERADAYQRVVRVAREQQADDHAKMVSLALVCAIQQDEALGRQAVRMAMKTISGPIKSGHVPFANDLARCAIVYDLCHGYWTPEERRQFHDYLNRTADANVRSETHVFHNGWYGYKSWGIGLACYATYHENPRAQELLSKLDAEIRTRAAPALELAGDGGGWAEGYYVNYWLYEWLFFCEVARWCEGADYYAMAPGFFRNRAVAGMFETYPGISTYGSRRSIPMGDGGGRTFGGDRDKALSARRILVNHFRDDPAHQAVHTFNQTTPRSSVGDYAYKDFLWRDGSAKKADLGTFRLSHISPGPGYIYARSSWDEDATYFYFKCGDRFTAHQHLDVGHFLIYKHEELAGDGGHYDDFGSPHDVNYHLRTIAHNTILVHDPSETWPDIRAGKVTGNDGGQAHDWPHHNGAVSDADAWRKDRPLYDIADILAFEDCGTYVYVAGDCTRAYSPKKLEYFTRQIVFARPGTFVIFDRVASGDSQFKKTWLLQAKKRPQGTPPNLVITSGKGRLFVQTVLPRRPQVKLLAGGDLYTYGGNSYPPRRDTGPAPECRVEISPPQPARVDYFLHVLTATDASTESVPDAGAQVTDQEVRVTVGKAVIALAKATVGGYVEISGSRKPLADEIVTPVARRAASR